jgi:hypothetical protein
MSISCLTQVISRAGGDTPARPDSKCRPAVQGCAFAQLRPCPCNRRRFHHPDRLALGQAVDSSGENFNLLAATIHRLPFRVRAKPILVGVGNTDYRKKSPVGTTCQFIFPDLRGGGRVVASVATRSRNSSAPARRMLRRPPEHGNAVPRELRRALRLPPGGPIHTAGVTMDPLD